MSLAMWGWYDTIKCKSRHFTLDEEIEAVSMSFRFEFVKGLQVHILVNRRKRAFMSILLCAW